MFSRNILIALSQPEDGDMRAQASDGNGLERRRIFLESEGFRSDQAVYAGLDHGTNVIAVRGTDAGQTVPDVDGLVTNEAGLVLGLTVADCLPVYLYDPRTEAIGLLHAGWRGLEQGVLRQGIERMQQSFRVHPEDVFAAIGPSIRSCHYQVGEEVARRFRARYSLALEQRGLETRLDLTRVARMQLGEVGVIARHIEVHPHCTYCRPGLYFSRRRQGTGFGLMLATIARLPS
ncbi:MAG: peptidoglycan editing factor PgeF [Candidatus Nomurabacteria bacterium]|nr:MAG: peptidoglycan editing factor PgeF [Candidatus Nomurabacteria bacterium]